ncbi:MAG: hypothetical protein HY236_06190 [Acidobacteria bacterium]|nr:hypothetical protein [Acidobacteriota bacterium]
MGTLRARIFLVVLLGGLLAGSGLSWAKPEYVEKEKRACVYCHLTAKSKGLNEAGQYYAEHGQLFEGYQPEKAPARSK